VSGTLSVVYPIPPWSTRCQFGKSPSSPPDGAEIVCQKCQSPLRLIALIKNEDIAKKILVAMHLPAEVPQLHPARPPPQEAEGGGDDCPN
jgi:hypothetical protein